MTTAERRRRRRRGGGLRVPSDNVPRRSSTPPPVAPPVPEDPSLAMSIAYSFSSDASEPIARMTTESPVPRFDEPMAPEAASTVVDASSGNDGAQDFEMKTREMAAVDLEALGLVEPGSRDSAGSINPGLMRTDPGYAGGPKDDPTRTDPNLTITRDTPSDVVAVGIGVAEEASVEVDMGDSGSNEIVSESTRIGVAPVSAEPADAPRDRKERLKTMALTDEDLEEVREAVRAASAAQQQEASASDEMWGAPAPKQSLTTTVPGLPPPVAATAAAQAAPQVLSTPIEAKAPQSEPLSVPEIDIRELSERSGEFEVDMDVDEKPAEAKAPPPPPPPPEPPRSRPPSVPPPIASGAASEARLHPGPNPSQGGAAEAHKPPPPPPPAAAQHKPPPAPPPAAAKKPAPVPKPEKPSRSKAWFAELFDEDYLRTLPFLTPQATQSEAEFVIDAMSLSPGAQVLDVGCGYGRHAMELAARGFHVVGLDLSTPLLVRGGEEAHRRGLEINFVRGDMRELDFEGQFDAAYCLFSTFGYFDDETNKRTVSNIARALKPGGRVMIEILNRDYVIADLPTRVWWEGEGCVVLEEVELNYFSSRIQVNRSVVFDDGRQLEQEISVRAYSLHEVGKLMHAAGFRVLEVSGGYQTRGRFFGNQSRHIIVVAERKDSAPT